MNALRTRLGLTGASDHDDSGFTMAEVIVSLFVFTIFILGLGYSLLSMTRLVGDDENRELAASLASQEIDRIRAVPDPFNVDTADTFQTVNNITFKIHRVVAWANTDGTISSCGSGGALLQYKSVYVTVTWTNQYVISNPVSTSTTLAPATRINDPSLGTIIVSVLGVDGTGRGNIPVTITPASGGTGQPVGTVDPTDPNGCTYALKVTPGAYNITLNKTGYINDQQSTAPIQVKTVVAGGSVLAPFAYEQQGTFNVKYASDYTANPVKLPSSLTTTFIPNSGTTAGTFSSGSSIQYLYPWSDGYSTVAGNYSSTGACNSVDPVKWNAGTVGATTLKAGVRAQAAVAPGGSGAINMRMGVIAAVWPAFTGNTITVKNVTPPSNVGDPGCTSGATYTYTYTTPLPAVGSTVYLAVPYGSWSVYSTLGSILTILPGATASNATQGEVSSSTIVTLDPRNP